MSFLYRWNDDETNAHLNLLSQIQFKSYLAHNYLKSTHLVRKSPGGGRLRRLVSSHPMTRRDHAHFQSENAGRDYDNRIISVERGYQQRY